MLTWRDVPHESDSSNELISQVSSPLFSQSTSKIGIGPLGIQCRKEGLFGIWPSRSINRRVGGTVF